MRERVGKLAVSYTSAFTNLELLVVLVIITILTSLLATSLIRAKVAGQRGACLANSKTIESLNLVGVPVIYPQKRPFPYSCVFEGKEGYFEIGYPYGRRETVLFVNCFDCHNADDPWESVHSLITVY